MVHHFSKEFPVLTKWNSINIKSQNVVRLCNHSFLKPIIFLHDSNFFSLPTHVTYNLFGFHFYVSPTFLEALCGGGGHRAFCIQNSFSYQTWNIKLHYDFGKLFLTGTLKSPVRTANFREIMNRSANARRFFPRDKNAPRTRKIQFRFEFT